MITTDLPSARTHHLKFAEQDFSPFISCLRRQLVQEKWTRTSVLLPATPFWFFSVVWEWTWELLPLVFTPLCLFLVVWWWSLELLPLGFVWFSFAPASSWFLCSSSCYWGCPPVGVESQLPLCLVDLAHTWSLSWSIAPIWAGNQTSLLYHLYWSRFLQLQQQFVLP